MFHYETFLPKNRTWEQSQGIIALSTEGWNVQSGGLPPQIPFQSVGMDHPVLQGNLEITPHIRISPVKRASVYTSTDSVISVSYPLGVTF